MTSKVQRLLTTAMPSGSEYDCLQLLPRGRQCWLSQLTKEDLVTIKADAKIVDESRDSHNLMDVVAETTST